LAEHGDKVSGDIKSEIEKALAEAKTAVEGGDPDDMQQKTAALTQAAMKLGEAMYKAQQAEGQGAAGGDAGASAGAEHSGEGQEEVVDAEFSEVDEENKG
jgi:molecular chaperone DnaK